MYKRTGKSHFFMTRTGSSSNAPVLVPKREDRRATGAGNEQLAMNDGMVDIELERLRIMDEKASLDHKKSRLRGMIETAKYQFKTKGIMIDTGLLRKWEADLADMTLVGTRLQIELTQWNRIRKLENSNKHVSAFITVAQEVLHPDVFDHIERVARDRASRVEPITTISRNVIR